MTIVLYNNISEKNVLNKAGYLTQVTSLTGTLRSGTNLVDPEIMVELATLPTFNYAYITEFNRYYFVRNITNINNKLWSVSLHCDVLYSFKDAILNMKCDVGRNEFDYDLLLEDNQMAYDSTAILEIIESENARDEYNVPTDWQEHHSGAYYMIAGNIRGETYE